MSTRRIDYTFVATPLGRMLVAATERGVCLVVLGGSARELRARLASEFPFAPLERDDARLGPWSQSLARAAGGRGDVAAIPLDVRGSCFQRRVWDALRAIPRGETRTYGDIARGLGVPRGARAVARACATNPVPLLVPCHRVVPRDGSTGGYAWGAARKRALLRAERERAQPRKPLRPAPVQGPWLEKTRVRPLASKVSTS